VTAAEDGAIVFSTRYANARQLVSWVLRLGEHARVLGPEELQAEMADRVELLAARHEGELELAEPVLRAPRASDPEPERADTGERREAAIRPERFARLVTLASILIAAGRSGTRLDAAELRERLQLSEQELREDLNVLNVVNFGGGSYVLYAELHDDGTIEVDPEPYSDNFDRPARLLPVEAKALVAAIDLIGDHLPEGALTSAREKIVKALGADPMEQGLHVARQGGDDSGLARQVSEAIVARRLLVLEYYKPNEDEFTERTVEPYALINGREGWYVGAFDLSRDAVRHFRLDRIKAVRVTDTTFEPRPEVDPARDVEGWPRTGEVEASRVARIWVSPDRARWAREERRVAQELADGSVVVELSFAGADWLVREVLKEAGDAAVLEPAERARPCASRRAAPCRPLSETSAMPSRRDLIKMTDPEAAAFLEEQRRSSAQRTARTAGRTSCRSGSSCARGRCGRGPSASRRRRATSSATRAPRSSSRPARSTRSCAGSCSRPR
jgi:proteasome accessory factor C